jgi:hypothetical protein
MPHQRSGKIYLVGEIGFGIWKAQKICFTSFVPSILLPTLYLTTFFYSKTILRSASKQMASKIFLPRFTNCTNCSATNEKETKNKIDTHWKGENGLGKKRKRQFYYYLGYSDVNSHSSQQCQNFLILTVLPHFCSW